LLILLKQVWTLSQSQMKKLFWTFFFIIIRDPRFSFEWFRWLPSIDFRSVDEYSKDKCILSYTRCG
jgi:hypothetical protein